jgi:hypothetical protein
MVWAWLTWLCGSFDGSKIQIQYQYDKTNPCQLPELPGGSGSHSTKIVASLVLVAVRQSSGQSGCAMSKLALAWPDLVVSSVATLSQLLPTTTSRAVEASFVLMACGSSLLAIDATGLDSSAFLLAL